MFLLVLFTVQCYNVKRVFMCARGVKKVKLPVYVNTSDDVTTGMVQKLECEVWEVCWRLFNILIFLRDYEFQYHNWV